ncbi:TPA: hypothetical protein RZH73_001711 [Campylobacter coli]|uniref:hypothetical protein n=1 Tax=Campylobacter coli TaxID=195 RepID=UPI00112F70DF|nr:hypothetical protein [Campylobacter coli]HEB7537135.1 hypothetical protein [Campylobacter coli]HEB7551219.1 hypothetical protein [Campylobacter coli]
MTFSQPYNSFYNSFYKSKELNFSHYFCLKIFLMIYIRAVSCPFVASGATSRHRTFPYRKSLHL